MMEIFSAYDFHFESLVGAGNLSSLCQDSVLTGWNSDRSSRGSKHDGETPEITAKANIVGTRRETSTRTESSEIRRVQCIDTSTIEAFFTKEGHCSVACRKVWRMSSTKRSWPRWNRRRSPRNPRVLFFRYERRPRERSTLACFPLLFSSTLTWFLLFFSLIIFPCENWFLQLVVLVLPFV